MDRTIRQLSQTLTLLHPHNAAKVHGSMSNKRCNQYDGLKNPFKTLPPTPADGPKSAPPSDEESPRSGRTLPPTPPEKPKKFAGKPVHVGRQAPSSKCRAPDRAIKGGSTRVRPLLPKPPPPPASGRRKDSCDDPAKLDEVVKCGQLETEEPHRPARPSRSVHPTPADIRNDEMRVQGQQGQESYDAIWTLRTRCSSASDVRNPFVQVQDPVRPLPPIPTRDSTVDESPTRCLDPYQTIWPMGRSISTSQLNDPSDHLQRPTRPLPPIPNRDSTVDELPTRCMEPKWPMFRSISTSQLNDPSDHLERPTRPLPPIPTRDSTVDESPTRCPELTWPMVRSISTSQLNDQFDHLQRPTRPLPPIPTDEDDEPEAVTSDVKRCLSLGPSMKRALSSSDDTDVADPFAHLKRPTRPVPPTPNDSTEPVDEPLEAATVFNAGTAPKCSSPAVNPVMNELKSRLDSAVRPARPLPPPKKPILKCNV